MSSPLRKHAFAGRPDGFVIEFDTLNEQQHVEYVSGTRIRTATGFRFGERMNLLRDLRGERKARHRARRLETKLRERDWRNRVRLPIERGWSEVHVDRCPWAPEVLHGDFQGKRTVIERACFATPTEAEVAEPDFERRIEERQQFGWRRTKTDINVSRRTRKEVEP